MDFKKLENTVKEIPEGNVFSNGFAWLIMNEYHNMTKEQLKSIIVELDYSIKENAKNSKNYNKVINETIENLKELEF